MAYLDENGLKTLWGLVQNKTSSGLKFNILSNTNRPATPSPKTIWVDTTIALTKYYISPTEPSDTSNGILWIKTNETGTETIVDNTIYHLECALVYDGQKWDYVIAWLYEGSWVQFSSLFIPYEYQRVEYLQSTGTQHILTGLVPINSDYGYEIEIQSQDAWDSSGGVRLFGIEIANNAFTMDTYATGRLWFDRRNGSMTVQNLNCKKNVKFKITKHQKNLTHPAGSSAFSTTKIYDWGSEKINICLFGATSTVSSSTGLVTFNSTPSFMLFTCKFFDENDKLVSELIPCYRKSDKEPGLWDRVRKIFLTNVGTGSFAVGADIL